MKEAIFILCFVVLLCSNAHAQEYNENKNPQVETSTIKKIKVFPNPATNVVNILGLINSEKADILVSDVYGNAVLQHQWRIKNNALNLPITTLDTGIYMITITSQEQNIKTKFYKK